MAQRPVPGADPITAVSQLLSRLPGIGERTAQRLTFHLLRQEPAYAEALAEALLRLSRDVQLCQVCHNFTARQPCSICSEHRRNQAPVSYTHLTLPTIYSV